MNFGGGGEFKSNPLVLGAGKNNWYKVILSLFLQVVFLILVSANLIFPLVRGGEGVDVSYLCKLLSDL